MSFRYHVRTGLLEQVIRPAEGDVPTMYRSIALGYSGHLAALNDPDSERLIGMGPIPRGTWRMSAPRDHAQLGHYAIPLTPSDETDTHGRTGFYVHGDSKYRNQSASHGCIVLDLHAREELGAAIDRGDVTFEVVAD